MTSPSTNKYFITFILVFIFFFLWQLRSFFSMIIDEPFHKQLIELSVETNKKLPMMIDEETRLENTVVFRSKVIQYNYTLTKVLKSDVDLQEFETQMSPFILNLIKTDPNLKLFRDNDVTMIYSYNDRNGNFLASLEFPPSLYK